MHLNGGKMLKYDLKGKTCRKRANGQNNYAYEKNVPMGLSALAPGLYIFI